MHPARSSLLLAVLLLQGCLTEVSEDVLHRSSYGFATPIAAVHLPPREDRTSTQVSGAFDYSGKESLHSDPSRNDPWFTTSEIVTHKDARARMDVDPWRAGLSVSRIYQGRGRLGLGGVGSRSEKAGWIEGGLIAGQETTGELFGQYGLSTVTSRADWTLWDTWTDPARNLDSSVWSDTSTRAVSRWRRFWRVGFHLGTRQSGPWLEMAWASQDVFGCPRSPAQWAVGYGDVAAGWQLRTPIGTWVPAVRFMDAGSDELLWSAGLQWTLELPR